MSYKIRIGVPEMMSLWNRLQSEYRSGKISKKDCVLYRKWGNAMKKLAEDPMYPSLHTHEIQPLSKRFGLRVWQSYLENKTSAAMRMYWVYAPSKWEITIIGLEPHPNDKNSSYDRIVLSEVETGSDE